MKLRRKKKSFLTRKRIIIIAIVAALAIASSVYWWFFMRPKPPVNSTTAGVNSINYSPPTPEEKQDSQNAKQNAVDKSENTDTQPPVTSDSLVVTINRAGQSGKGQPVSVRTQIDGTGSGTCDMVFTRSSQTTVTKTFQISFSGTAAICNGDINASEFATGGDWLLTVTAKVNNTISKPSTQTVTVEK